MLYGTILAALLLASAAPSAMGDSIWIDPAGGDFNVADNWGFGGVPDSTDTARFDLESTYTVRFTNSPINDRLTMREGDVTFDLQGHTYTLARNDGFTGTIISRSNGNDVALTITGGTVASTNGSTIGLQGGSTGAVTVTGTDSTWSNGGRLEIGDNGNGTLRVENGGQVSNIDGVIAHGSTGTATVTGSGSTWTNSFRLYIGGIGNGTLRIKDGGQVSNTFGLIGYGSGSTSDVGVAGAGSTWTNDAFLSIGYNGNGTLRIENGGQVSNTDGVIARLNGSTGTATVTGSGSTWTNSRSLRVGGISVDHGGNGTLSIGPAGLVEGGGEYTQYSNGTLGYQIAGADADTGYGFLDVYGNMTLDGDLIIDFIDTFSASGGDAFDLFDFGGLLTGEFDEIFLPTLSDGLAWNTSALYDTGTLSVVSESVVVPTPTGAAAGLIGLGLLAAMKRPGRRRGAKADA